MKIKHLVNKILHLDSSCRKNIISYILSLLDKQQTQLLITYMDEILERG